MRFPIKCLPLAISLCFAPPAFAAAPAAPAAPTAPAAHAAAPAHAPNLNAFAPAQKVATVEGITEYRLANGMRVLFAPDQSKPTTTVNVTYLVGSRHESYGETGMAHLLEHLTYKGTPNGGNLMEALSTRGMQFNGTTFLDRTNYYETFPASDASLSWALEMEADRMLNSIISRADLEKEFSVVRNEMEMGENNPRRSLWKQLTAVSFDWHNYSNNTIGARSDVEGVKIESLQAFYRKYYQPDNAVLMVAGKFDPVKTLGLVERIYGTLPKPTRPLEPTYTTEAQRDGARELTVKRVGDVQLAAAMYLTSAGAHPDSTAIDALGEILAGTPNGRLHKTLVEPKKAVGVDPWAMDLAEPGYIIFWAELSKTQSLPDARKVMLEQIENLAKKPVTEAELARAKASLLNQFDKVINDPQRLAVALSESIAKGDWRLFFLNRDRIEALTVADVQRVAQNYFKESNRTFGQFVPTTAPDRTVIPATPDVTKLVQGYQGKPPVTEGEAFDISPANIEKRTTRLTLPNGLKLALTPKKSRASAVSGNISLSFGDEKSLFGQAANASLTAEMLTRGAGKLSRADITAKLDTLKTKLAVHGAGQSLGVNFETSRDKLPEVLDLLRDILRAPTFPPSEFAQLQDEVLSQIEANRNEPMALANQEAARGLNRFKPGDIRYRQSFDEMAASFKAAKLQDVKRFYGDMAGMNHARIALVGDFDAKEVEAKVRNLFGDWRSRAKYTRLANPAAEPRPDTRKIETADKANAAYQAALPMALQDTSPDYAALLVASEVLGGGPHSRLMSRLRQKDGVSYGAGGALRVSAFEPDAALMLYAIYAPQNLAKVQTGLKEELERFARDGLTEQELTETKQRLLQKRQTSRAQDNALAGLHTVQLDTGRTLAFTAEVEAKIMGLTLAEVNAAIKKHVAPEKLFNVYAGDFAGVEKKEKEKAAAGK